MNVQAWLRDEDFVRNLSRSLVEPLLFNKYAAHREEGYHDYNVVGFGVGRKERQGMTTDQLCLVVYVREKLPEALVPRHEQIRTELHVNPENLFGIDETSIYRIHREYRDIDEPGIPTDVQAIGVPRFDAAGTYTGYVRPMRGGMSVGWRDDETGSIGCFVRDRQSGNVCILSAAHVLGRFNQGQAGNTPDIIIQPGGDDGGKVTLIDPAKPQDFFHVARFVRSAPVVLSPSAQNNTADAAIAELIRQHEYRSRIEGNIGTPVGEGTPREGMLVQKTGRTTGYTLGKITNVASTFRMRVGNVDVPFTDLITTSVMTKGGDSGSLLLCREENRALGLLLGSSANRSFFCKFTNVKSLLDIELP